jgi:DNA polymerase I-like protein with 3'-5' exonuclease and polymerase domains
LKGLLMEFKRLLVTGDEWFYPVNSVDELYPIRGEESVVAIDIETTGLNPTEDRISVITVSFPIAGDTLVIPMNDSVEFRQNVKWFLGVLYNYYELVAHNAQFDLGFIQQEFGIGYPKYPVWDTMLAEQLIYAGYKRSASLAETSKRRLGREVDKSLQTSFAYGQELSPEQVEYAALDVEVLFEIRQQQKQEFESGPAETLRIWDIEQNALPVFSEMWRRGIGFDLHEARPIIAEVQEEYDKLELHLQEVLTPFIVQQRVREFDEAVKKRDEYEARLQEQVDKLENYWYKHIHYQKEIDQHPDISWEFEGWNDESIDKKDNKPKGLKRYVRFKLSQWRKENPRPPKPHIDNTPINLGSAKQMVYAINAYGYPLADYQKSTLESAQYTADEKTVDEVITPLLAWKQKSKFLDSFGEKLIAKMDSEGKLHAGWRQLGTSTGRCSAANPNLLQIPKRSDLGRRFRKCFVAGDGNVFIKADYSQMELRLVAELSGDTALTEAFNKNQDIHLLTAGGIFHPGVEYEKLTELVTSDQRDVGKTTNFATLYGMGPQKLQRTNAAQGIKISLTQAQQALDGWKTTWKEAARFISDQGTQAVIHGYTETALGRRRYFSSAETKEEEGAVRRAGANHPIQGSNADITKIAMKAIQDQVTQYDASVVLQVYDEIVVESPVEYAMEVYDIVVAEMENAARLVLMNVPVKVDAVITPTWSEDDKIYPDD